MSSGTDKIVSSIMSEAQEKADKIIQDAEAQIEVINQEAANKAEAEKNKILDNGKKQSDMRYQQIISEAKMNARRDELEAKEEVIEAAFAKASENLKEIASTDNKEYIDALTGMIKEAAIEIGGGDLILQLKEEDIGKVKGILSALADDVKAIVMKESKQNLNLNSIAADVANETSISTTFTIGDPIDTIGGAILKTQNGEIEVNNTIEARLVRFKKLLRSEVASVLFN